MTSKLETRLTRQLAAKGVNDAKQMAEALLTKRGDLKDGSLTESGRARQSLGAAGRAKDRAARASGKSTTEYTYDKKTNRATLK